MAKLDPYIVRADFPILQIQNRGKPLIYLDTSASAQKPHQVIDAIQHYYTHQHANIHRGVYELSEQATQVFEGVRHQVKSFINAQHAEEIIFVRGTTEAINLVAHSYGRSRFQPGDEIVVSVMEHHSNIVPWQMVGEVTGAVLRVIPMADTGELDLDAYRQLLTARTKLIAVTHISNVLGTINPIKEITALAHAQQIPVLVDGAQAAPFFPVDVQALDCDFYAFSSHKMYGPTGVGVLYGKKALLETMPPYQGGGDMIETVSFAKTTYAKLPNKFEAGTPNIAAVVGLGAAIRYLQILGMENIASHEQELLHYATEQLQAIAGLRIFGTAKHKAGVIAFVVDDIHPHDIATVLDHAGIAVRAGHHCAMPLMERLHVPATVRVSLGLYNTREEIDQLMVGLQQVKRLFG
ncbi:MAG: cysteine sulfinate desulfinase [Gammaproteobacteria bacterium RIFCSPHIGHO2_12_FULL_41_20]|nr:MAG: cysteine sulfinate desulfinase [Gammaproteobacteria bacterium RIFCSPHIGHO2_12_FULL_41_20]